MRIEIGAPVVVVPAWGKLWHLPVEEGLAQAVWGRPVAAHPTVCGLEGGIYAYRSIVRGLRFCAVCREGSPAEHLIPEKVVEKRGRYQRRKLAIA